MISDQLGSNFLILLAPQLLLLLVLLISFSFVRRLMAAILLVVFGVSLGVIIGAHPSWLNIALGFFGFYQLTNIARVVENRLALPRLRQQVVRSGIVFAVLTSFCLFLSRVSEDWFVSMLAPYKVSILVVCGITLLSTLYHLLRSRIGSLKYYSDEELPTLSVLIPARNEDSELADCIHAVVKNDYPKLEVLVLDDCSQDSSSDIIKQFAHNGVRFIQGELPKEKWLAKNQAYETLASSASGDWLFFMGVDVRVSTSTLKTVVTHALNTNKKMLSILPRRENPSVLNNLLSPLRYWWLLALPGELIKRQPVLSTSWLIEKKSYKSLGGMAAIARTIVPESYFARELNRTGKYRFIRSDARAMVTTSKTLGDQFETSTRLLYPQMHRQLEYAALTTLFMLGFWIAPAVLFVVGLVLADAFMASVFGLALALLVVAHVFVVGYTSPKGIVFAIFNLPYLLVQEMFLLNVSAYRYEFSEVVWKGRNICYPVMHITPHLPDVDGNLPS